MEKPEEKNEFLELIEPFKPIVLWIKNNNSIFIYSIIMLLFSWYLNPIIKESRFKNSCALGITKITKRRQFQYAGEKDYKELGEKFGLVNANWNDLIRFCKFYKSSDYS
tara:strand:+ start:254 stop:580 length:327 start_codon:yes stop_codon:yes gene_type:complete